MPHGMIGILWVIRNQIGSLIGLIPRLVLCILVRLCLTINVAIFNFVHTIDKVQWYNDQNCTILFNLHDFISSVWF